MAPEMMQLGSWSGRTNVPIREWAPIPGSGCVLELRPVSSRHLALVCVPSRADIYVISIFQRLATYGLKPSTIFFQMITNQKFLVEQRDIGGTE